MTATPREPFPYSDDFRRAKRNSLIWSGITLAIALGTPATDRELSTFSSVGVNLGFEQNVLIVMSGVVAVFMGFGFYQAMQRLRIHASNLFLGTTDVDEVFAKLSKEAQEATARIQGARATFERASSNFRSYFEISRLHGAPAAAPLDLTPPRQEMPHGRKYDTEEERLSAEINRLQARNEEIAAWLIQKRAEVANSEASRKAEKKNLAENGEQLVSYVEQLFANSADSYENLVVKDGIHLEKKVLDLKSFHDGIYHTDRRWFWLYDVAPVCLLGLLAAIPFGRALFSS